MGKSISFNVSNLFLGCPSLLDEGLSFENAGQTQHRFDNGFRGGEYGDAPKNSFSESLDCKA